MESKTLGEQAEEIAMQMISFVQGYPLGSVVLAGFGEDSEGGNA